MAESKILGGAYLSTDGKTWHDANGKVIPNPFAGEVADTASVTVETDVEKEPVAVVVPQDQQKAGIFSRRGRGNKDQPEATQQSEASQAESSDAVPAVDDSKPKG